MPKGLPTSIESKFGYIRYKACVVLEIPMEPIKKFKVPFTVIREVNLNTDPALRVSPYFSVNNFLTIGNNDIISVEGTGNSLGERNIQLMLFAVLSPIEFIGDFSSYSCQCIRTGSND